MEELPGHQHRVLQVLLDPGELRGVGAGRRRRLPSSPSAPGSRFFDLFDLSSPPAVAGGLVEVQAEVGLAVHCVHAGLDLGVDPEGGALLHRAEEEGLEVEEDLVVAVAVSSRLVRDDRGEVPVATPGEGEFYV